MAGVWIDTRTPEGRAAVRASLARLAAPRNAYEAHVRATKQARAAELRDARTYADRAVIEARHQAQDDASLDRTCGAGFAAAVRAHFAEKR